MNKSEHGPVGADQTRETVGPGKARQSYRKPLPEPRGQIRPSLIGSPPDPPGTKVGKIGWL